MKKAKISVSVCVHFLLCATLGTSSEVTSCIADDLERISLLKQNIPKDYKITVRHVPKEAGGMCWVVLNVFHLEESLRELAQKFGNVSSNRDSIDIYVQTLQDVRFKIISRGDFDLESAMEEFQCHYREERWATARYFDYVGDLVTAANSLNESRGCEPPLCPSAATEANTSGAEHRYLSKIVEKSSLLWMLIIPLAMGLLCLVCKMACGRRRRERPERDPADGGGGGGGGGDALADIEGEAALSRDWPSARKMRLGVEMV